MLSLEESPDMRVPTFNRNRALLGVAVSEGQAASQIVRRSLKEL
jgi:hypothetical protein